MSVQCHFLSTNTLQKKFFKLTTLVPIAAEMNLNIKRLQTLTASSVVDCTACRRSQLFHGRGEGEKEGLIERRRGFTYTPCACRDLCLRNLCVIVPFFQEENLCSWIEIVLKISPTLSYRCVTSQNHLFQGTFKAPQKTKTAKCTFKRSTHCKQGGISQIFHHFFPLSHVMLFEDIVWSSVHRKQGRSKRWATKM